MVDFNNETTIGTPSVDVEKISILQRRYDCIEAIEFYRRQKIMNVRTDLSLVRCRLLSLFLELQPMLKRRLKDDSEQYERLKKICFDSNDEKDILDAFCYLNEQLDEIHLTKIDSIKVYDISRIVMANKYKSGPR